MSDLDDQADEVRGRGKRESGGAQIRENRDRRVSMAIKWFWGLVGAGIASSGYLVANNLYQLNLTVARGIDADKARDDRLNDHEARIRSVERELNVVEGKVFRGEVDEFGLKPDAPPPKHGH
jgi:hypothetical protein